MATEKKCSKEKKNILFQQIIGVVSTVIIVFLSPFITKLTDKILEKPPTEGVQKFVNYETQVEHVGIEYIECELSASPDLSGYQVKPYPYIICETSDERIYVPICEQFSQLQYSADQEGKCQMLKEDLISDLKRLLQQTFKDTDVKCKVGCLVVIQYTSETNKSIKEIYELQIGQLTYADKDICINVINENADEKGLKIRTEDMKNANIILEQVKRKLL